MTDWKLNIIMQNRGVAIVFLMSDACFHLESQGELEMKAYISSGISIIWGIIAQIDMVIL